MFIVELKKPGSMFSEKNKEQLVSYMRLKKIEFGILFGETLQLYYEEPHKYNVKKICDVSFEESNSIGFEIVKLLLRENCSKDSLKDFCDAKIREDAEDVETEEKIKFLCSEAGIELIEKLLQEKGYSKEILDRINIKINKRDVLSPRPQPSGIPRELLRIPSENIQDWVKRIFTYLFNRGYIDNEELKNLHDKEYSRKTFGIAYPLLCDDRRGILDNQGHARYWINWRLQGKYYVCSQWWKEYSPMYERKLYSYITHILLKNKKN